jgi:hypothetical protein
MPLNKDILVYVRAERFVLLNYFTNQIVSGRIGLEPVCLFLIFII